MILGIGVVSAIALIIITPLYYLLLKCNNDKAKTPPLNLFTSCNSTKIIFTLAVDITSDMIGIFFRLLMYFLFAWGVFYKRIIKCEGYIEKHFTMNSKRKIVWFLIILIPISIILLFIALSAIEPTFSYLRDTKDYHDTKIKYTTLGSGIIVFHAVVKSFSYFCMLLISLCSAKIFYNSSVRWKKSAKDIQLSISQEKLYNLYYNYVKVGREISTECNSLSQWFFIMYCECFVYLLLNFVNIARIVKQLPGKSEIFQFNPYYNIVASVINLIIYGIVFSSYCMAYKLNSAHQAFYRKFIDSYLGVEIVLDGNLRYKCIPGCKPELLEQTNEEFRNPSDDRGEEVDIECQDEEAEEKYKEYFKKLPESLILTKVAEFDFVPSCFISVPLKSLLYTFTVITTIVSFALSSQLLLSDS